MQAKVSEPLCFGSFHDSLGVARLINAPSSLLHIFNSKKKYLDLVLVLFMHISLSLVLDFWYTFYMDSIAWVAVAFMTQMFLCPAGSAAVSCVLWLVLTTGNILLGKWIRSSPTLIFKIKHSEHSFFIESLSVSKTAIWVLGAKNLPNIS